MEFVLSLGSESRPEHPAVVLNHAVKDLELEVEI